MNCSGHDTPGDHAPHGAHLSCAEICKFLCDYVDGDLPKDQHARFLQHMGMCPPCKEYMRQYEETIRLSKRCCCSPKTPPVPPEMVQAILKSLAGSETRP
jgi:anti-sigma factor RsiW